MSASREVLVFDAPGAEANEAIAGLTLAGYTVFRATDVATFEQLLAEHGPPGSTSLAAVVVDLSTAEDVALDVLDRIATEPALRATPKVHLIRPGQKPPKGERTIALKRPVATPALIRLLEHMSEDSARASTTQPANTSPFAANGVPSTVGEYEILDKIASGGMGTVYLAQRSNDIGFQRLYAVKLIHPHLAHDGDLHGMVLDEAAIASRIHHPNVAAVVDLGLDAGRPYVVMQYVEGCSLAQLLAIRGEPRCIELIVHVILDVLEGLQIAHDVTDDEGRPLGIVHRDVSPDNILVGLDGVARLTDFGVAKARNRLTMTQKGVHKGKLLYLAPEQLLDAAEIDRQVDVFAAGVVLWHALTGRKLFYAESPAGVLRNIMEGPILPPSKVVGSAALKPLDAVCLRALERDPTRRFPSARAMGRALRQVAGKHGLLAPPESVGAWVDDAYGEELAARRRSVRRVRGARSSSSLHGLASQSGPGASSSTQRAIGASASYSGLGSTASDGTIRTDVGPLGDPEDEGTSVSQQLPPRPWKTLPWTVIAAISAVAAVVTAGVVIGTCDARPPAAAQDESPPAPALAGPAASEPRGAESETKAPVRGASVTPAPSVGATATPLPASGQPPTPAAPVEDTGPPPPAPKAEDVQTNDASGKRTSKRRRSKRKHSTPESTTPPPATGSAGQPAKQAKPKPVKRNPVAGGPEANPYKGG